MGMMGAPLPPPPGSAPPSEFGGGTPGGGMGGMMNATPVPPQPPSPQAMQAVQDIHAIVTAGASLAQNFPTAVPLIEQLNRLVQQLQMKIVQSLPPTEVPAPPV